MFKKFTDTLSGTLDTVKSYGSSMVIGQAGQGKSGTLSSTLDTVKSYGSSMVIRQAGQAGTTTEGTGANVRPPTSKLSLNLPLLGNGSASAPATTANSPDRAYHKPSLASNTLAGIQSTLGKFTGRGDSTNAAVMASHQSQSGRGPVLGRAVETNETRITGFHDIDDDMKGLNPEDISSIDQYRKFKSTGQFGNNTEYSSVPAASEGMNGSAPKMVRSNTDEIIDQQFKTMMGDLDNVLDETEQLDELDPVLGKKGEDGEESKKPKKKKNKCFVKCIRCIQDNRVKGGCVDPEEMADAAEDNLVLKKVLNIVFVVIGILLFAAVFVVIIYTSVVKKDPVVATTGIDVTPRHNDTPVYLYEYDPLEADNRPDDKNEVDPKLKALLDVISLPEDDW